MSRARYQSTFRKLALAFLALGVAPLIVVCLLFLHQFQRQATQSIESTMEEANYYAQSKVNDLLSGIDQSMDYLYDYSAGDYGTLCELLEDGSAGRNERQKVSPWAEMNQAADTARSDWMNLSSIRPTYICRSLRPALPSSSSSHSVP